MGNIRPLEKFDVKDTPKTVAPGCYALFRRYEPADPDRFKKSGWTCLRVVSTPDGLTLDEALQAEVGQKSVTGATHFVAVPCELDLEMELQKTMLIERYSPIG